MDRLIKDYKKAVRAIPPRFKKTQILEDAAHSRGEMLGDQLFIGSISGELPEKFWSVKRRYKKKKLTK